MSTKATAARIYAYGEPDVFRLETVDVPDPVGHEVLLQGCAELLEILVRDAGGPEGLYVDLAIQVEACAARRSEASRLQGMGANLALPAHWNSPTQH
jgi:hypothetical protein